MPVAQQFFVLQLGERSFRPFRDAMFAVQILDAHGRAKASGYLREDELELTIGKVQIPTAVIEAARRQPVGKGQYVDIAGNVIEPF